MKITQSQTETLIEGVYESPELFMQGIKEKIVFYLEGMSNPEITYIVIAFLALLLGPRNYKKLLFVACISIAFGTPFQAFLITLVLAAILFAKNGIKRVPQGRFGISERFGKFNKVLHPGLNFIVPGIDSVKKDMRIYTYREDPDNSDKPESQKKLFDINHYVTSQEVILDPVTIGCICSDNTILYINTIVYFQIVDLEKAIYNVEDLGRSLLELTKASFRQETGRLNADAVISSREIIGARTQEALEIASERWGTRIVRVEIQTLDFDDEVQKALQAARAAELRGRAEVIRAERERDAVVATAEGDFEAARLGAEALFLTASRGKEGEAKGLRAMSEALQENPGGVIAIEALKAQESVARSIGESNNALILPSESLSLVGAIGSISHALEALGIKEKEKEKIE